MDVDIQPFGDQAARVQFGDALSAETCRAIGAFCRSLARRPLAGVVEWVPAYVSVAVFYQPLEIEYSALHDALRVRASRLQPSRLPPARIVTIPTRYGGAFGPDLDAVAALHSMTTDDVIRLHSSPTYLVHMLGFLPGFPYLGGLPDALVTPRRPTPRLLVPAGSVGIAGAQTGVYPLDSPGGWQIIGQTSLRLFDPSRCPPALLRAGDGVKFVPT